jgi:hypothetical protein
MASASDEKTWKDIPDNKKTIEHWQEFFEDTINNSRKYEYCATRFIEMEMFRQIVPTIVDYKTMEQCARWFHYEIKFKILQYFVEIYPMDQKNFNNLAHRVRLGGATFNDEIGDIVDFFSTHFALFSERAQKSFSVKILEYYATLDDIDVGGQEFINILLNLGMKVKLILEIIFQFDYLTGTKESANFLKKAIENLQTSGLDLNEHMDNDSIIKILGRSYDTDLLFQFCDAEKMTICILESLMSHECASSHGEGDDSCCADLLMTCAEKGVDISAVLLANKQKFFPSR